MEIKLWKLKKNIELYLKIVYNIHKKHFVVISNKVLNIHLPSVKKMLL